ncbi:MAG: DUF952 domain-containing protein [Chlamydiota bacterium]
MDQDAKPHYLYKIISQDNWEKSQTENTLVLSKDDQLFIHFSTEDQVERILVKYWSDVPECTILKVATDRLPGNLVYEANPGGTSKYYHLYEGEIPLKAVVEATIYHTKK